MRQLTRDDFRIITNGKVFRVQKLRCRRFFRWHWEWWETELCYTEAYCNYREFATATDAELWIQGELSPSTPPPRWVVVDRKTSGTL